MMSGSKYSAIRRAIARSLATPAGRDVFAKNDFRSETPIVAALEDERISSVLARAKQHQPPVVIATMIDSRLRLCTISPSAASRDGAGDGPVDPNATIGMLFNLMDTDDKKSKWRFNIQKFAPEMRGAEAIPFRIPQNA